MNWDKRGLAGLRSRYRLTPMDAHSPQSLIGLPGPRPWVRNALVGLNVAVFAAMVLTGVSLISPSVPDLLRWGANQGPLTAGGEWWRLLTCTFLHIGIIHLAFNMVVLWSAGATLERLLGHVGFLVVYVLSGLAGSLASMAWNPDVVSAGASGAIFGLYGALLGFLLRDRGCLPKASQTLLAKNALAFVGYNMVFGLAMRGVDMAAHLGGLAGGVVCGLVLAIPAVNRRRADLLVFAGGLVAAAVLAVTLPRDRGLLAGLDRIGKVETQALEAFDGAAAKARAGTLDNVGFAGVVEQEVVPGLHRFRIQLEALEDKPNARKEPLQAMARYTQAREEAFARFARALRHHDEKEAQAAMDQLRAAAAAYKKDMKE
jgi:rhomboid protease GluP